MRAPHKVSVNYDPAMPPMGSQWEKPRGGNILRRNVDRARSADNRMAREKKKGGPKRPGEK